MKILSAPEGDGLLGDIEVLEFLREKRRETIERNAEARSSTQKSIKPPRRAVQLEEKILKYLEDGPAGLQTKDSVELLVEKLKKFDLMVTEVQMIANLRTDSMPRLMGVIEDCEERFSEEQVEEIRGIVEETLEKMPFDVEEEERVDGVDGGEGDEREGDEREGTNARRGTGE